MIGTQTHIGPGRHPASLSIARLQPPGLVFNTLHRFGVRTIGDLMKLDLSQVRHERGVGLGKYVALMELRQKARLFLEEFGEQMPQDADADPNWELSLDPGRSQNRHQPAPSFTQLLFQQGIDLETPWREVLAGLPMRAEECLRWLGVDSLGEVAAVAETGLVPPRQGPPVTDLSLPYRQVTHLPESVDRVVREADLLTVKDLLQAVEQRTFAESRRRVHVCLRITVDRLLLPRTEGSLAQRRMDDLPNFGATSLSGVRGALLSLAQNGLALTGDSGPQLVRRILESLGESSAALLHDRYLCQRTLRDIAAERGIDTKTVQQQIYHLLRTLGRLYGPLARTLTQPLLLALRAEGGILPRDLVAMHLPDASVVEARFLLAVGGERTFLWDEGQLTLFSGRRLYMAVNLARGALRGKGAAGMAEADLRLLIVRRLGPSMEGLALSRALHGEPRISFLQNDRVVMLSRTQVPPRQALATILREACRPLSRREIAAAYAGQTHPKGPAPPQEASLEAITRALRRLRGVICLGQGNYAHQMGIGLTEEKLQEVLEKSADRLRGTRLPRKISALFKELSREGVAMGKLTPMGLHWLLGRHPELVALRGQYVCCKQSVAPEHLSLAKRHPRRAAEWHPEKNGALTPEKVKSDSQRRVHWLCHRGHEWIAEVSRRVAGQPCPQCTHETRESEKEA